MKTKIVVFLVVISVCLCLSGSALANKYSRYEGTWKGKSVVYNTTCKSLYKNGATENFALKIKKIKQKGSLKAVKIANDLPDYAKAFSGKIKGHSIKFHYTMWGSYTTYDLKGTIKGKEMLLHSFNNYPGRCEGGWHLEFDLKKK